MFLIMSLILLLSFAYHPVGWSHFKRHNWKKLYLLSEDSEIYFSIAGYSSGVQGTGILYMQPQIEMVDVDYYKKGQYLGTSSIYLNSENSWFMVPPLEELNPVAHIKGLV